MTAFDGGQYSGADGPPDQTAWTGSLRLDGGQDAGRAETDEDVVLVADDDEAFAETVQIWLEPEKSVILAYDGDQAVDAYGPHVDVVLLDRRMPMMSGDEALQRIRDGAGDPAIAVMTAINPDENIAEMDIDTYLQKPVMEEDLVTAVDSLLERVEYPDEVRRLFGLRSKLEAFRETHSEAQLAASAHYQRLQTEFDQLADQASQYLAELDRPEINQFEPISEERL